MEWNELWTPNAALPLIVVKGLVLRVAPKRQIESLTPNEVLLVVVRRTSAERGTWIAWDLLWANRSEEATMFTIDGLPTFGAALVVLVAQIMPLSAWAWCAVRRGQSTLADESVLLMSAFSLAAILPQVREHHFCTFLGVALFASVAVTVAMTVMAALSHRQPRGN